MTVIEVVEHATGNVVHTLDGGAFPEKVERGVNINIDGLRFYTRLVESPE